MPNQTVALIKDIIGSASLWPRAIRRLFWTRNLSHFQRFLVVCFCYVNGLSPADFWDWANLLHLCRGQHIEYLFQSFHEGRYGDSYYAYNVSNARYEYLNGTVRHYQRQEQRN